MERNDVSLTESDTMSSKTALSDSCCMFFFRLEGTIYFFLDERLKCK